MSDSPYAAVGVPHWPPTQEELLRWADLVTMHLDVRLGDTGALKKIAADLGLDWPRFLDGDAAQARDRVLRRYPREPHERYIPIPHEGPRTFMTAAVTNEALRHGEPTSILRELLGSFAQYGVEFGEQSTARAIYFDCVVSLGRVIEHTMRSDRSTDDKVKFLRELADVLRPYAPFAADDLETYQGHGL